MSMVHAVLGHPAGTTNITILSRMMLMVNLDGKWRLTHGSLMVNDGEWMAIMLVNDA